MKFYEVPMRLKRLMEMSDHRKDAIHYLRDQSIPYTTHICKYILWASQNSDWEDDWSDEIFTFLKNVASTWLKGNKRLKEKDYLDYFFYKNFEATWEMKVRLEETIREFTQRYNYPEPNKVDVENAFKRYKTFVTVIKDMIINDEVDYNDIKKDCKILMGVTHD